MVGGSLAFTVSLTQICYDSDMYRFDQLRACTSKVLICFQLICMTLLKRRMNAGSICLLKLSELI